MSIIHAFDGQSEEILKPSCTAPAVEGFPKTVIAVFEPELVENLRALCPAEEIASVKTGFVRPVYKFAYKGHELGIYMTVLGGPATVGLMEEIISMGAEKFLIFGACGVLDRDLAAGRLILPIAARRDEGTSYHYMPPGDYVDIPTAGRLEEIFRELNLPYVAGRTWTTDAIYRETRSSMEARKREGCIAVEMECASVMAAARFRGIDAYQFLYAEDSLDGEAWDPRTWENAPRTDCEKYLRIALETAIRL